MKIKIAKDFSYTPGPRYIEEGSFSGQEFRINKLMPALKQVMSEESKLVVDLDGTAGYGRSFLEESFGGLIREERMNYSDIIRHLDLISLEEPNLIDKIEQYLKQADEKINY